jgi:hypothetical protein
MKSKWIRGFIFFLLVLLFPACQSSTSTKLKTTTVVLDGKIERLTESGRPCFAGYIKNVGNSLGMWCSVSMELFSDANKSVSIGTAGADADWLPNRGTLSPGERVYFKAVSVCDNCTQNDIKSYKGKIEWTNEDYSKGSTEF